MKTILDPSDRARILERVDRLEPDSRRHWGVMTLGHMLRHTADQLRAGLGELESRPGRGFLSLPGVRQFAIYYAPWPRGSATAPVLVATEPVEVAEGKRELRELIERFGCRSASDTWTPHPTFGRLSGKAWGVLAHRHLDHHLRQFGV